MVRVTAGCRDQLRELRTELELLRCIARRTESARLCDHPLSATKYTSEDRKELAEILADAKHTAVQVCIAIVDQEFDDLRKEMFMPAINEGAEQIAQQIAESGVMNDAADLPPPPTSSEIAVSVEEALVEAEAELAKIAAMTQPPSAKSVETPQAAPKAVDPAPQEPTQPVTPAPAPPAQLRPAPPAPSPKPAPTATTVAAAPSRSAGQTEEVVGEIESGIRKLASILSSEVNDQWKRAEESLAEIVNMSVRMEKTYSAAESMFSQITKMKDEVEIARDDAEVARREAKALRDDARRAKELAEAAAGTATRVTPRT